MARRSVIPHFAAVFAVGICVATLTAQDKPAPASKPSADETAIRAALKTLAKALQDGDAKGVGEVLHADGAMERKMVDAMASMAAEIARLHKSAAKAFGEDAAKELTGDLSAELSRIDDAEIIFSGADAATVRYKPPTTAPSKPGAPSDERAAEDDLPPPPPVVLKKIEGRWRVPVSELSRDTTPEEIAQRLADLDAQMKLVAELTGEIAKGKHKSAAKAAEAWQAKMMQALSPRTRPTTEPSKGKAK